MIQFPPPLYQNFQTPGSFPFVIDFLLGLAFVFMVLAPAILASRQQARCADEDE